MLATTDSILKYKPAAEAQESIENFSRNQWVKQADTQLFISQLHTVRDRLLIEAETLATNNKDLANIKTIQSSTIRKVINLCQTNQLTTF